MFRRVPSIRIIVPDCRSAVGETKTSSKVTRDVCLLVEAKFGSMADMRRAVDWHPWGREGDQQL